MTLATYRPIEAGEPYETMVDGHLFRANIPKDIGAHIMVMQLLTKSTPMPDRPNATSGIETRVPLLDVLRQNPHFEVEGFDQAPVSANVDITDEEESRRRGGRPPNPTDDREYQAHAMRWINRVKPNRLMADSDKAMREATKEMRERWFKESDMRDACGVGGDVVELIMNVFRPKYEQLGGRWPMAQV